MKKRIVKCTALLFAAALLALPGKAFSSRQTVHGVSACSTTANLTCENPITPDLAASDRS